MLTIGDTFPDFNLKAVVSNNITDGFKNISLADSAGKWKIFFFWPKDFTFVCPTEIIGFGDMNEEFKKRNTQVYGLSTDSEFVHLAWRNDNPQLKDLPFPMVSDITRSLSEALGILHKTEKVCLRATFIVDPENVIRHVNVNDLSVGRNPEEVLRLLDAFQTGELCGCSWKKGEPVIKIA